VRVVDRGRDGDRACGASVDMAEGERERLKAIGGEVVLVEEDCVMRRSTCTKLPGMTVEIIIEVDWVDDARVDNRAHRAVPASVRVDQGGREEDDLVAPADDDQRDSRAEAQFCACTCGAVE